ncbi:hypothetical protein [Enterococcus nangangensis]|uniref:hypothetical protein n=1 Tax=Enterococcus nangangensis TaxID=2559926 RepID=UPI0010F6C3FB|nr:hypothetical protein [Enterococcus nangangensis]
MLDTYLKNHNTTRYQLSKASGITASTLQRWSEMPLDKLPVRALRVAGELVGCDAWEVLKEMQSYDA